MPIVFSSEKRDFSSENGILVRKSTEQRRKQRTEQKKSREEQSIAENSRADKKLRMEK